MKMKEKLMNTVAISIMIGLCLGIALISLASAETIIAGGCLPVNLSELESLDNVVYDVVGNSSNLEGLTIDLNGTMANICTVINYKLDSFTLVFIDNSTKTIIKEVPVSGSCGSCSSSSKTKYIEVDNYLDRVIYKLNETKIQELTDDLNELEEELRRKEVMNFVFRVFVGIVLMIAIILIVYLLNKKRK